MALFVNALLTYICVVGLIMAHRVIFGKRGDS